MSFATFSTLLRRYPGLLIHRKCGIYLEQDKTRRSYDTVVTPSFPFNGMVDQVHFLRIRGLSIYLSKFIEAGIPGDRGTTHNPERRRHGPSDRNRILPDNSFPGGLFRSYMGRAYSTLVFPGFFRYPGLKPGGYRRVDPLDLFGSVGIVVGDALPPALAILPPALAILPPALAGGYRFDIEKCGFSQIFMLVRLSYQAFLDQVEKLGGTNFLIDNPEGMK